VDISKSDEVTNILSYTYVEERLGATTYLR
jgi:hypothetical protein